MSDDVPAPRTIYMRAVVDAAALPPLGDAGATALSPTDVAIDSGALILTSTAQAATPAGGPAALAAGIGDRLRFYAITGSNNFEDAVLINDIRTLADRSISGFAPVRLQRTAVLPEAGAQAASIGTPEQDFWFWQGAVADHGIQDCSLVLALYRRDETGRPRFAGFYRWDLQLTVFDDTSNPEEPEEETP